MPVKMAYLRKHTIRTDVFSKRPLRLMSSHKHASGISAFNVYIIPSHSLTFDCLFVGPCTHLREETSPLECFIGAGETGALPFLLLEL
jgi:hypothetical protein